MINSKFVVELNPAFDFETGKYQEFGSWQEALYFIQRKKIKHWIILKVGGHYEIH